MDVHVQTYVGFGSRMGAFCFLALQDEGFFVCGHSCCREVIHDLRESTDQRVLQNIITICYILGRG